MWLDITPKDIKGYERGSGSSFILLLSKRSLSNLITLVSVSKKVPDEEACDLVDKLLEVDDLDTLYEKVFSSLKYQGYISEPVDNTDGDDSDNKLMWSELWDSSFADALALGVSSSDYWSLSPKTIIDLCDVKITMAEDKLNEDLAKAWLNAQLTAVGVNDPKKFPSKPPQVKAKDSELTEEALVNALLGMKGKEPVGIDEGII